MAGLDEELPPQEHALRCVEFAKQALGQLAEYNHRNQSELSIRVGIHSAPLVAAVMGDQVRNYELYGESFELSQTLESLSSRGRIHISRETFLLVDSQVDTEGLSIRLLSWLHVTSVPHQHQWGVMRRRDTCATHQTMTDNMHQKQRKQREAHSRKLMSVKIWTCMLVGQLF